MNIQRSADRPQCIVVVRTRCAEQRHHCIAYMLVDRATVAENNAVHLSCKARDQFTNLLGIERSRQRCEAAEISKQDRDLASLAGRTIDRRQIWSWR